MSHESPHDRRDAEAQTAAEQPPRIDEPVDVRAYRRLYAALRGCPVAEPPADFGMRMEALVRDAGEQAVLEIWLVRCCAVVAIVAGIAFAAPAMFAALVELRMILGEPSAWLLPGSVALGAAWCLDRWLGSSTHGVRRR